LGGGPFFSSFFLGFFTILKLPIVYPILNRW
jgi:hypothetical protein